ncbi:transglycosylase domain-containing protein [Kurthia sibirica]|uniref:Penicillin-binding protein n=1 Tax=Kurthia sibirica TaxID=202750 RepID=A0A2U3AI43_9BACL|nr:PBP1A family penicillin-binding protein [Kurthia sibirica]PWI24222.1 penicillin-binding protein [Kurthia sibirica]GEK34119.1 penicillin-binding protein 1A/1B [Kurthia sibirica]
MDKRYNSREERRRMEELEKKRGNRKSSKGKKNKPKKSWFKRIFLTALTLGMILLIGGGSLFAYYAFTAPKLNEETLKDPVSSKFFDINGKEFYSMGTEERDHVSYEDIPQEMIDAILSTEDSRFNSHHGIDFYRLGGAVLANFRDGFGAQGASTLTQQVIKNSFLNNGKTLKRKAQEAYLSLQLEREYSKNEIFEMYFNKVLMSGRIYGFGTASQHFYGKSLDKLTLPQMALLAGMPQSPNNYNAFKNPELAEKRRNTVLKLMYNNKKITKDEMDAAMKVSVKKGLLPESKRVARSSSKYDAFVDVVLKEIAENKDEKALEEGVSVYTTLDPEAQKIVEKTVNNDANFPTKTIETGISVVNTQNGEISAIGGARNYGPERGFNFAQALKTRQPGSTMKPIMDYGPAIENLKWSTGKIINDSPMTYSGSSQQINNYDNKFRGNITMREALYNSRNIPAIKAFKEVGTSKVKDFIGNFGITPDELYESDAIGGGNVNLSPIDMSGIYASFGNNGIYIKPHAIKKIVYRDGNTAKTYTPEPKAAMSDYTAYMLTDMMRDVVSSKAGASGSLAAVYGVDIAGKTGTTNYTAEQLREYNLPDGSVPDSWFAGYSSKYSISVWTGYAKRSNGISTPPERQLAQNLFRNIMTQISAGKNTPSFVKPNSVIQSGNELFVRGTQVPATPTPEKEDKEEDKTVAAPTGLNATYNADAKSVSLSWNKSSTDGANYRIAVNGKAIGSTEGTTASYNVPQDATSLTFTVVAVANGKTSAAASATVKISTVPTEPEIDEPETETPVEPETETPKPETETPKPETETPKPETETPKPETETPVEPDEPETEEPTKKPQGTTNNGTTTNKNDDEVTT